MCKHKNVVETYNRIGLLLHSFLARGRVPSPPQQCVSTSIEKDIVPLSAEELNCDRHRHQSFEYILQKIEIDGWDKGQLIPAR